VGNSLSILKLPNERREVAMRIIWSRPFLILFCLSMLITGCGPFQQQNAANTTLLDDTPNLVIIPKNADLFSPFILTTRVNTQVIWRNDDTLQHRVTTTPESSLFLNPEVIDIQISQHGSSTFTFTKPGLYHYFDTGFSDWSPDYLRVAPQKTSPSFPLTMEGVIWVQGPIPNLPMTAGTSVVYLHDRILDNFLAIQTGGTITWHNYDTDAHFFQTALGWDAPVNPVDVGLNNLLGQNDYPPDGESKSLTFSIPGLYYYYCFTHAAIDPVYLRVYAKPIASEFPIPMEGFVLVE
jgi:plastocyanin